MLIFAADTKISLNAVTSGNPDSRQTFFHLNSYKKFTIKNTILLFEDDIVIFFQTLLITNNFHRTLFSLFLKASHWLICGLSRWLKNHSSSHCVSSSLTFCDSICVHTEYWWFFFIIFDIQFFLHFSRTNCFKRNEIIFTMT